MNPTVAVFEERGRTSRAGPGRWRRKWARRTGGRALHLAGARGPRRLLTALYGGTVNQFKHLLRKLSIEVTGSIPTNRKRGAGRQGEHEGVLR